jgi:hypothetical protein
MRYVVLLTLLLVYNSAAADEFIVKNNGEDPIYRLYAWPTELVPRTTSIIGEPIYPGEKARVDVDNEWENCEFTFEADRNLTTNPLPFEVVNFRKCGNSSREVDIPWRND